MPGERGGGGEEEEGGSPLVKFVDKRATNEMIDQSLCPGKCFEYCFIL